MKNFLLIFSAIVIILLRAVGRGLVALVNLIKKPLLVLCVIAMVVALVLFGVRWFTSASNGDETGGASIVDQMENMRAAGEETIEQHEITWPFYIYREPDFRAERITRLAPQTVDALFTSADGWALIETSHGEHWAYLSANRQFLDRTTGLFVSRESTDMDGYIRAQVVHVLEEDGTWMKIETEQGPRWIDREFVPPTYELDTLLQRHGNYVSIYFENLETGFVYRHNAERVYFSASVPKAAYALYIYQQAEAGEVDLDNELTYTEADVIRGSGVIRHQYSVGATFTRRELLRLNVSESDNVATLILQRVHGLSGYRTFISEMGGNPYLVGDRVMNSELTADEAGRFAREIFAYLESDGRYSDEFKAALLDNQFPFIVSDYPVASKTGWTAPWAWHDMAIVYAPSPYILVILSQREGFSDADYEDFAEISMAFQAFNDLWFVGGEGP